MSGMEGTLLYRSDGCRTLGSREYSTYRFDGLILCEYDKHVEALRMKHDTTYVSFYCSEL